MARDDARDGGVGDEGRRRPQAHLLADASLALAERDPRLSYPRSTSSVAHHGSVLTCSPPRRPRRISRARPARRRGGRASTASPRRRRRTSRSSPAPVPARSTPSARPSSTRQLSAPKQMPCVERPPATPSIRRHGQMASQLRLEVGAGDPVAHNATQTPRRRARAPSARRHVRRSRSPSRRRSRRPPRPSRAGSPCRARAARASAPSSSRGTRGRARARRGRRACGPAGQAGRGSVGGTPPSTVSAGRPPRARSRRRRARCSQRPACRRRRTRARRSRPDGGVAAHEACRGPPHTCRERRAGTSEGSIIAALIATHSQRNDPIDPGPFHRHHPFIATALATHPPSARAVSAPGTRSGRGTRASLTPPAAGRSSAG